MRMKVNTGDRLKGKRCVKIVFGRENLIGNRPKLFGELIFVRILIEKNVCINIKKWYHAIAIDEIGRQENFGVKMRIYARFRHYPFHPLSLFFTTSFYVIP